MKAHRSDRLATTLSSTAVHACASVSDGFPHRAGIRVPSSPKKLFHGVLVEHDPALGDSRRPGDGIAKRCTGDAPGEAVAAGAEPDLGQTSRPCSSHSPAGA